MQVNTSAGGWSPKWKASTVAAATLFQASPYMLGQTMNTPTTSQAQVPTPSVPTSYVDQRLLDAKLEAVEARTETKFAQLLGELKVISANVANLGSQIGDVKTELGSVKSATAGVKWNILATGLAVGALILGLFAFGQQMMQIAAALVGLKK